MSTSKDLWFVILCHNRTNLYWCPDRHGYTTNLAEVGVYSAEEAGAIERLGRGDTPVPLTSLRQEFVDLRVKLRKDIDGLTKILRKMQGLNGEG